MANFSGNINLAKLEMVGVAEIKGKRCVVIPIEYNDIFIKKGDDGKFKHISIGATLWEKKEPDKFGNTHAMKQSLSKEFRELADPELVERKKNAYLGDFKPYEYQAVNEAATVQAPVAEVTNDDDLPF